MTKILSFFFVNLLCCGPSLANPLNYKRPCKDLSPGCLKKSIQAALPFFGRGAPQFGIEPLDPYFMEQLNLTLAGGISIEFSQGFARGLKKCVVDFARIVDDAIETQMHCNLTIKGKYKSSGQLLMFSIDGDGESVIKCHNLRLYSILELGKKTSTEGLEYLDIISAKVDHSYDGRVSYSMSNIFKGNPEISKMIVDFMNSNWRMIAEEFGKPMVEYGAKSIIKNVKKLFKVMSVNDLKDL